MLLLQKSNPSVVTKCSIAIEAIDTPPGFRMKAHVPDTTTSATRAVRKAARPRMCDFQLGAAGPYRRCDLHDVELLPGATENLVEFEMPGLTFSWTGAHTECVPVRLEVRCYSFAQSEEEDGEFALSSVRWDEKAWGGTNGGGRSGMLSSFSSTSGGVVVPGGVAGTFDVTSREVFGSERGSSALLEEPPTPSSAQITAQDYCVLSKGPNPTDKDAEERSQFDNGRTYSVSNLLLSNGGRSVYGSSKPLLSSLDADIDASGVRSREEHLTDDASSPDGEADDVDLSPFPVPADGSPMNPGPKNRLVAYYHWSLADLFDDDRWTAIHKKGARNGGRAHLKTGEPLVQWRSLYFRNWELSAGITLLRVKIDSLVPGMHYRLALLRGKNMPWSENHVDGVGGTLLVDGSMLLERAVSAFPGHESAE